MNDESTDESGGSTPEKSEVPHDEELRTILRAWQPPHATPALDERLRAAYRKRLERPSPWKQIFAARISVPVPVALAVVVLLLVGTSWALRVSRLAPQPAGLSSAVVGEAPHAKSPATASQPALRPAVSPKPHADASAIVLQTEQGSIPLVTDTKYRLNQSPKIYVGGFFNPSSER